MFKSYRSRSLRLGQAVSGQINWLGSCHQEDDQERDDLQEQSYPGSRREGHFSQCLEQPMDCRAEVFVPG